jgi:hypothetical protein
VETANRFARDLVAVDSPQAFLDDGPTAKLSAAEFDKAMTITKLRGAQGRGPPLDSHAQERPEVVAVAKSLHTLGLSLRAIAERLEAAGYVNSNGRQFAAVSVRNMLG